MAYPYKFTSGAWFLGFVKKNGYIYARCYIATDAPNGTVLRVPIRASMGIPTVDQVDVLSLTVSNSYVFCDVPIYAKGGTKTRISTLSDGDSFGLTTPTTVGTTYDNDWDSLTKYSGSHRFATSTKATFAQGAGTFTSGGEAITGSSLIVVRVAVDYNNGVFSYKAPLITRTGYKCVGWVPFSSGEPVVSGYTISATTAETSIFPEHYDFSGVIWYPVWEALPTYILTYNANGGSLGSVPSTQTFESGSVTLSSYTPTRTGYTFKGWGTSSSATTSSYATGSTQSFTASKTIYAIWEGTVTFYANGGSGAPSAQTFIAGKSLTLSSTKPTRSGYVFQGWAKTSSSSTVDYKPGTSYTFDGNTNLYAVWGTEQYLYFNMNDGSGGPSTVSFASGASVTIPSTKPTRTGCTFLGWAESKYATAAAYSAGSSYTFNYTTTLYAVWRATVTFNANSGSGAPSALNVVVGQAGTIPSTTPTRTGYTFLGWSTSSSSTQVDYYTGNFIYPTANVTLYAVWQGSVSYDANGGSGAPSKTYFYAGKTATISSATPTRNGYSFAGWSTSSTATSASYQAGGSFTPSSGNVTLYAVWTVVSKRYKITFTSTDIPANVTTLPPYEYTDATTGSLTIPQTIPESYGYTFKGWGISPNVDTPVKYRPGDTVTFTADTTLYAVWEEQVEIYTLTYNANGGSLGSVPATQTFKYGVFWSGRVTLSSYEPTRANCEFIGWGDSPEYDGYSTPYAPGSSPTFTSNKTLYAQWNGTISYWMNVEENGDDVFLTQAAHQDKFTITEKIPNRKGYTFKGWSRSKTATEAQYVAGMSVNFEGNLRLYAIWEQLTHTLTFNAGEGTIKGTSKHSTDVLLPYGESFKTAGLTAPIAELNGKHFVGWYDENNIRFETTTQYGQDTTFLACYTDDNLYGYFPLIIGGKPVAVRPHVVVNGKWVRASAYVYSASQWNPTCCPSEYGYGPPEGLVAHMPRVDGPVMYSGNSVSPILLNYSSSEVTLSGDTTATAVGSYILRVTPKAGYTWEDGSRVTRDIPWTIQGKDKLSKKDIPVQTSIPEYTGTPMSPQLNYDKSKMNVTFTPQTDAGEYEATATAKDGYEWEDTE